MNIKKYRELLYKFQITLQHAQNLHEFVISLIVSVQNLTSQKC